MAKQGHKKPTEDPLKSRIPQFASVEEAAAFWDSHSTTDFEDEFEDATGVQFVLARGEPSKALTVRLSQTAAEALTRRASEMGVSPAALVRLWVLERLSRPESA